MDARDKRFYRVSIPVAALLMISCAMSANAPAYARGGGWSSSDARSGQSAESDKGMEARNNKSSARTQRSPEVRTQQREQRSGNTYTPPVDARNQNDRSSGGARQDRSGSWGRRTPSETGSQTAPGNRYNPPANNGNQNDRSGIETGQGNPYGYRQRGGTNQGSSRTRPGSSSSDATDIRTRNDNPYNYRRPGSATSTNAWKGRSRDGTGATSGDNGGRISTGTNPSNTREVRPGGDTTARQRGNGNSGQNTYGAYPTTRDVKPGFRLPDDPRKNYRKEYEDIGSIWRQRIERRDHRDDRDRRHDTGINIFIGIPVFQDYCYDYRPLYSYPSAYCYYYDYFPPYIYGDRIRYFEPFEHRRGFSEITIFMNYPDDYQYSDPTRRALNIALSDIEQAWEQKDIDRFMAYVRPKSSIAIFLRGSYNYSLDWLDYSDMTRDAMGNIKTQSFQFDRVTRRQQTGEIVAYGRHKFYDWDGSLDTVYVSYTFERVAGDWYITEAGTSNYKNW